MSQLVDPGCATPATCAAALTGSAQFASLDATSNGVGGAGGFGAGTGGNGRAGGVTLSAVGAPTTVAGLTGLAADGIGGLGGDNGLGGRGTSGSGTGGALLLNAAVHPLAGIAGTLTLATVNGTASLSAEQVRVAAALDGQTTFALDVDGARGRIAALPKVRNVKVTKQGWNTVSIEIEERVAWGSWQINGVNVPIDIDGYVLDGAPAPEGSPLIVEIEPQRVINTGERLDAGALQLASRLVRESQTAFGRSVMALVYKQNSGLTAVLSGSENDDKPLWVTFGDSRDYDYKVAALYVLIEQARQSDVALSVVDLRFGDRLTFQ